MQYGAINLSKPSVKVFEEMLKRTILHFMPKNMTSEGSGKSSYKNKCRTISLLLKRKKDKNEIGAVTIKIFKTKAVFSFTGHPRNISEHELFLAFSRNSFSRIRFISKIIPYTFLK